MWGNFRASSGCAARTGSPRGIEREGTCMKSWDISELDSRFKQSTSIKRGAVPEYYPAAYTTARLFCQFSNPSGGALVRSAKTRQKKAPGCFLFVSQGVTGKSVSLVGVALSCRFRISRRVTSLRRYSGRKFCSSGDITQSRHNNHDH